MKRMLNCLKMTARDAQIMNQDPEIVVFEKCIFDLRIKQIRP